MINPRNVSPTNQIYFYDAGYKTLICFGVNLFKSCCLILAKTYANDRRTQQGNFLEFIRKRIGCKVNSK